MTDPYLYNGQSPDDHVASCPDCTAAIALVEADLAVAPPPRLREAVLSKARRRRTPAVSGVAALAVPYAAQIALMDELLADLSTPQWDTPIVKHGTVRGTLEHLTANDTPAARLMGVPRGPHDSVHRRWREQAGSLLQRVSGCNDVLLDVELELAGTSPARGSLRQALVQRTFETWTHADDIRTATGRDRAEPPGDHVRMIAAFGLALLPKAVKGPRRDVSATVMLTGPGGGTWNVPLTPTPQRVGVVISADAVGFCRLLANRLPPDGFPYAAEGDARLAHDLVHAAATLGCD